MNGKSVALVVVTLVVVVAAWQVSQQRAPETDITRDTLYPDLVDELNKVASFRVRTADKETLLERQGDAWRLANKDGFPADGTKVRKALLQLAELRQVEAKTADPARYDKLGLADTGGEEPGRLIEVGDNSGAKLVSLIVGHDKTAGDETQYYVRRSDEAQSWLVAGELEAPADPVPWVDAGIVDVDTERVRSVEVSVKGEKTILVTKEMPGENFFTLQDIPDGFEQKSKATVSSLGALLLDLRLNDVASLEKVGQTDPIRTTVVKTFDGLVATLNDYDLDGETYTAFDFAFDQAGVYEDPDSNPESAEDNDSDQADAGETGDEADELAPDQPAADDAPQESVADEVKRVGARSAGWTYVLPKYKRRMIDRSYESLIKAIEEDGEDAAGDDAG